ncbi:MAG TPA: hypothetical protein PKD79_04275, partial [Candidatus Doudnabacteria bacterium]|nr:hypothetical protein [Candidatus Doudnabacteria bacterium]
GQRGRQQAAEAEIPAPEPEKKSELLFWFFLLFRSAGIRTCLNMTSSPDRLPSTQKAENLNKISIKKNCIGL